MHEDEKDPMNELPEIPAHSEDLEKERTVLTPSVAEPEPKPKSEPRLSKWKSAVAAVALVALGAAVGSATTVTLGRHLLDQPSTQIGGSTVTQTPPKGSQPVIDVPAIQGRTITSVYQKVGPAVVKIEVQTRNGWTRGQGSGSGFVVDSRGYILTNHHVINGARTITVKFIDGTTMPAKVVGSDRYMDLAVIKVDASDRALVVASLGDSDAIEVGELAIAIGSPFGNEFTVTSGIISGLNRSIIEQSNPFQIPGAIQTDAAINPGNSGGPLLNAEGRVIGINTAIESPTGSSIGIGFAVPVNAAKRILPTLIAGEKVSYPWLGVGLTDLTNDLAKRLDVAVTEGAVVSQIYPDSPAMAAGLKTPAFTRGGELVVADVIVAIDGRKMDSADAVVSYLSNKQVGDQVQITVLRGEERTTLTATMAARPDTLGTEQE